MGADDHVIVLGGEDVSPDVRVEPRRRSSWWVLVPVAAVFVALIAFVLTPEDEAPTVVDPSGLEAPPEPPRAYVEPTIVTVPEAVPEIAIGWKDVAMVGGGSHLSDVDHGAGGWLAVAESLPIAVHTSTNGVLWEARSLVEMTGFNPQAAVGDGVMAVAASTAYDTAIGAAGVAVSDDGGQNWVETVLDRRPTLVSGVSVVGTGVYVFGQVLDELDPSSGRGRPVVWRQDGSSWSAVEDPSADTGMVTAVLEGPDGSLRAFGDVDGAAASWMVGGITLEPASVPPNPGSFVEVDEDGGGGFLAVGGDVLAGMADGVWRSDDLVSWEPVGTRGQVSDLIGFGGAVLGVVEAQPLLVRVGPDGEVLVRSRYSDVETGWEGMGYVSALATDGDLVVMAGQDETGRPVLAVRGTTLHPVSLPAFAESAGRWVAVAEVGSDAPGATEGATVVPFGDSALVSLFGQVWQVEGLATTGPTLSPALEEGRPIQGWRLGRSPSGVWAFAGGGDPRIYTYGEDGTWTGKAIPMQWVDVVTDIDGVALAMGYTVDGSPGLARSEPDGDWVVVEDADPPVYGLAAVPGAVFGYRDDGHGHTTSVVSTDGVSWEPVEGILIPGVGTEAGVPYLVDVGVPSLVRLLDRWPGIQEVEVPTTNPLSIQRFEDELWVRSPGAIWIGSPDGSWEQIAIGVQYGVGPFPAVIPGDAPTLVVADQGRIQLLRLER